LREKQQIPGGNDSKKSKCKSKCESNYKSNSRYFDSLKMTILELAEAARQRLA